jgi:hypothetical protein
VRWWPLSAATALGVLGAGLAVAGATEPAVTGLRWQARGDLTIVSIDVAGRPGFRHQQLTRPDRIVVDLEGVVSPAVTPGGLVVDRLLADVRLAPAPPGSGQTLRLVLELWRPVPYEVVETAAGIDVVLGRGGVAVAQAPGTASEPAPAQGVPTSADSPEAATPEEGAPQTKTPQPPSEIPAEALPQTGPPDGLTGEERFSVIHNTIRGNRSLSFLNGGTHYVQELDLAFRKTLGANATFEGSLGTLSTDDTLLAPDNFLLQKLQLRLFGSDYELAGGDLLSTLSTFTLANPVKGLSAWKDFPVLAGLRVSIVGGVVKTRWDEFWTDSAQETFTRFVGAVRVEQRITPEIVVGATYLQARDDQSSIPGSPTSPTSSDPTGAQVCPGPVTGTGTVPVFSPGTIARDVPGAVPIPGSDLVCVPGIPVPVPANGVMTVPASGGGTLPVSVVGGTTPGFFFPAGPPISNHVASMDAKVTLFGALSLETEVARSWTDTDETQPGGNETGNAYLVGLGYRRDNLRAAARYLRVEPGFVTGAGFVFADQEEFSLSADYDFPRWATVGASYLDARDNLDGAKASTTRARTPEVRLSLRDLPYLDPLVLDLRYRLRKTESGDQTIDDETQTFGIDATYALGPLRLAANYEHQNRQDFANRTLRGHVDTVGASAQLDFPVWLFTVSPLFRYQFISEQRLEEARTETTQYYEAGLGVDWPGIATLGLAYQKADTDSFVPRDGLVRWMARAELRIRLFGRDDRLLTLSYEQRDYDYAESTRDFTEEIAIAKVSFQF